MGSITRSLSNNITTGGVILPAGITNDSVSAVTYFANASSGETPKLWFVVAPAEPVPL